MKPRVRVPIVVVGKEQWGELKVFGQTHEICGEVVRMVNQNFSFAGGHRVRLYKFKKNVHWKIPAGTEIDISAVPAGGAPRRR